MTQLGEYDVPLLSLHNKVFVERSNYRCQIVVSATD